MSSFLYPNSRELSANPPTIDPSTAKYLCRILFREF